MRVVMTTSDTLNRVLSNEKAEFVDSLLYDSGLDIFDAKLIAFKEYKKAVMALPRITCNVEVTNRQKEEFLEAIENLNADIFNLETVEMSKILDKIKIIWRK